jgi:SAM-dependent methyltransferase
MPRKDLPQNVYDDPDFLSAYSQLERWRAPFGAAFEHPAFLSLLPDVAGLRVLDLGCGAGQLALHLANAGAVEVIGLDVSQQMLDRARVGNAHPRVTYVRQPIENADFPDGRFDLVVSSLAIHYVEDYAGLVTRIAGWLVANGTLVFSTEHPIVLARASDEGWVRDGGGEPTAWGIDRYGEEGRRERQWFGARVRKYHRMLTTLLNGLLDAGLTVERVIEPMPTDEQLTEHPDWIEERRRPTFLLVRARRLSSRARRPRPRPRE